MLKEIQTAWLSEERKGGHSKERAFLREGPMVAKDLVWAMVGHPVDELTVCFSLSGEFQRAFILPAAFDRRL